MISLLAFSTSIFSMCLLDMMSCDTRLQALKVTRQLRAEFGDQDHAPSSFTNPLRSRVPRVAERVFLAAIDVV